MTRVEPREPQREAPVVSRVRTVPAAPSSLPGGPRPLRTTTIAGGRTVGYYEYGDPDGVPVVALHGTPGCGAGFSWAHQPAVERRVRLLAPDRPGIGLSDPVPQRPVRDYAGDLGAFGDALGVDRFAVLGYSGGGPFACAAAHGLADRLENVAVVAGAGHVGEWAHVRESDSTDRMFMHLSTRVPAVASLLLQASSAVARRLPRVAVASAQRELAEADRRVVAAFDDHREIMAAFTEAFLRGSRGVVDDYAAVSRPWGFAVEEIKAPVQLWHGDADRTVPIDHTYRLAERLPDARVTVWPDEGHLALITRVGEVLDSLVGRSG